MAKYPQWEYDLLRYLGTPAPLTNDGMDAQFPNSLLALNLWAQSEGNVTNNPLATSGKGAGAANCVAQCGSSSPIYEYDNEADGVAQMGKFLQGSFYSKIVSSLVANDTLSAIYQAINQSPWCKGCQGGKYPEALAAAAGGGAAAVSSSVGTGGTAGQGGGGGANPQSANLSGCVVPFPLSFSAGPINISGCLLNRGQVKAITAAAAIAVGIGMAGVGVFMLAAVGFNATGAKQQVQSLASKLPGPAGNIVRAGGAGGGSSAGSRSVAGTRRAAPRAPAAASEPQTAGRRESRQIERRYEQSSRDVGGIGPRGGVPGQAARARQEASSPGARPRRQPTERRRPIAPAGSPERRARAERPF